MMPGVIRCTERSTRVARRRLDENVFPSAGSLQEFDQQRVIKQTAGEAEVSISIVSLVSAGVLVFRGEHEHRILDCFLQTARDGGREGRGNRRAIGEPQRVVKLCAKPSRRDSMAVEESRIKARGVGKNPAEQPAEALVPGSRKPLHLVLLGPRAESEQI